MYLLDEYFKDESEGTAVETAHLEGEFHKFVTTKGGTEAKYKHEDFFIGRWGNTPCFIRSCDIDAKFKQRELDALKTEGSIHENFIRYFDGFGLPSPSGGIHRYFFISCSDIRRVVYNVFWCNCATYLQILRN